MTTSVSEAVKALQVKVSDEAITADLMDGRTISVPIGWYPRLAHATPKERRNYRFIGAHQGIHWPDLDEDISIENLLSGRPSGESNTSFGKWLASRKRRRQSVGPSARS